MYAYRGSSSDVEQSFPTLSEALECAIFNDERSCVIWRKGTFQGHESWDMIYNGRPTMEALLEAQRREREHRDARKGQQ